MRQLQPVIWAKGTFLTPHHLQLHDQFLENLVGFRQDALSFRPWGLLSVDIDREALSGGYFKLRSTAGLFPDGLPFEVPESDPAPAPKQLAPFLSQERDTLDIFLAVPAYRTGGLNLTTSVQNLDARYMAGDLVVRDENTGQTPRPVQVGRKNLRILADDEVRAGTPAMQIARLRKTQGGVFDLDLKFVPPLLDIGASNSLNALLRRLIENLTAKSAELSGMRRQKNDLLAEFTSSDVANFWLLYTVNTHLPVLRHIFETRRGHPEVVFQALLALAGALTTFSPKIQPRDLPTYVHDQLGPCFEDMEEKLKILLGTVVPKNFVSLQLRLAQPSVYGCSLDDEKYLANTKFFLAVSAEMPESDLITKAPQKMKVCSMTHVDHLIRQALDGVSMRHLSTPPAAVPMKLKYQYFALNQAGPYWEAIRRARNFAVYVPGDFPNVQLELIILLPQG